MKHFVGAPPLHHREPYLSITTTLKGAKQIPIGNKMCANENMQLQVLLYECIAQLLF